jgi:hypothetical protein
MQPSQQGNTTTTAPTQQIDLAMDTDWMLVLRTGVGAG